MTKYRKIFRHCNNVATFTPLIRIYFNGLPTFGFFFFFFIIVHIRRRVFVLRVCIPSKHIIKVPVVRKYYLISTPRFVYTRLARIMYSLWRMRLSLSVERVRFISHSRHQNGLFICVKRLYYYYYYMRGTSRSKVNSQYYIPTIGDNKQL